MSLKQILRVYVPTLLWALIIFFGSVLLPIFLVLFSMGQPPASIARLFPVMNENKSQLDLLLLLTPLSFLYLFTGYRLILDIRNTRIKDAEAFAFYFIALPGIYLLAYTFFVAFYFLGKRDLMFLGPDFLWATLGTLGAFFFLIILELGIGISRIAALSARTGETSSTEKNSSLS